ncbi:uncharacterized protein LOC120090678 [Benincasa hispida]|uniref:uncharacterized protein LOC120090678 n=1 Tax=Benincasa hispida TaxID=102211 RepID=UPI0019016B6C|nr:uncharacterized protein LOC120090678 [Benincasa hispida]
MDPWLVFNGLLCHYILLKEVEEDKEDVISFKLLGKKVSFGREEFDIVTNLRYRPRHVVEFDEDIALKLGKLYFGNRINMNGVELDKDFSDFEFKSDEDVVKLVVSYFIELEMMRMKRSQHMDLTMLGMIDVWEDFCSYDQGNMIFTKTLSSL